jgi:TolA-binding protein
MKRSGCDRLWEVDALREGRLGDKDAASFERHTAACAECRQRLADDEHLRELALGLPLEEPTELELRRLRSRILSEVATGSAPRTPQRWPLFAFMTVLVVAGAAVWMLVVRRAPPLTTMPAARTTAAAPVTPAAAQALAGSVTEIAPARWSQLRSDSVEHLALDDGTIRVHVRPQQAGERFLVVMPDGEIEVRGTTFDVSVTRGATTRVHVDEGIVDLRLKGRDPVSLGIGATWSAAAPSDTAPTEPMPAQAARASRPAAARSATPAPLGDGAQAYADAVRLLQDGRTGDAASAFHALVMAHPHSPEAEDASYLEAVALARIGRGDAAALAAEHHLASFPVSFHRREAAILIARAAAQRGDCERARAALTPWTATGVDPEARTALRPCDGK